MSELNKELIDFIDNEFIIVDKNMKDILSELDFKDEEEALLCESIMSNLEKSIADGISNMKVVQLPFIGTLRINPVRRQLSNSSKAFHIARTHLTKEEYKQHVGSYVIDLKEKQAKLDRERLLIIKIKRNNKIKYNELFKKFGKAHAEMYIYAVRLMEEIPFNSEWEEQYQKLKENE